MSLVSIIINNYNYGRFLRAAIESALDQTYPHVEVVVVDDGSTDDSCAIIRNYSDRIVPVYKQNGGQASALNAGFVQSHGDIVIFLDSDDILARDCVERVVQTFQFDPSLAKVMYRMEVINADGAGLGIFKPPFPLRLHTGNVRQYVLSFPFDMTWTPTSGNAFTAHVLRQIFPIPEEYRILADFYLVHLTPLFGHVAFLESIGAYYRVHGGNHQEREPGKFDLPQLRRMLINATTTCRYIKHIADTFQLEGRPENVDDLYSVSLLSMRLVSLKLDRAGHPFAQDSAWWLCYAGIAAALRRFDVAPMRRAIYIAWFVVLATAPRALTLRITRRFLLSGQRQWKTSYGTCRRTRTIDNTTHTRHISERLGSPPHRD